MQKNEADAAIYSSEKSVNEYKDKVPTEIISSIETELQGLRSVLDSEDAEVIREKINSLQKATMKIGEHMQQQSGGSSSSEGSTNEHNDQDEEQKKKEEGK